MSALALRKHSDRETMGEAATQTALQEIRAAIRERGEARVIFACAPSQNEFLAALIRTDLDWSHITVFHMDEYVGLPAGHPQSFRSYLREHLLAHLPPPRSVHLIAADAEDLDAEGERYARLLSAAPIDLVCMGIGENGHLAFNDPPVADFDDPLLVKRVELDRACRAQQVHDGCFPGLADVPTHALTLTIPALLRARAISCVVPGERKSRAIFDTLRGEITTACPASILRTHHQATLHIDAAAASLLDLSA